MREIRPEIYWTHLYWLTVLEEQKLYPPRKSWRSANPPSARKSASWSGLPKTLVHRTTRSVTLSEDGLRLVAELNEPFGQIREIFAPARGRRAPARYAAPDRAGRIFTSAAGPGHRPFLHQHPQLHLQLEVTDRLVSLASEGFDLAIRHCRRELLPETHVAWPLCRTATLVVASADYIRRFGRPDSPDALRQHQCLTYPRGPQSPHWTLSATTSG
jgi:DNA-binding transcriptional LysR family regulator